MKLSRRRFLGGAAATGLAFSGLRKLGAEPARAAGYGPLKPDPKGVLDLPAGFSYRRFSETGQEMDDGLRVPGAHDGMAAFPGPGGRVLLVRNHELTSKGTSSGPFGKDNTLLSKVDRRRLYDDGGGKRPALGGTTTLVYDPSKGALERHFLSLGGTIRNCAGGPTPWGSWVTCEETVDGKHGYNFEVPASAKGGLVPAVPLKAMGRFNHEAIAVHPESGAVYETEDRRDGLIYRYLPRAKGKLAAGGRLQAMRLRDKASADTRNWGDGPPIPAGRKLDVDWVDLDDVESPKDDLRKQGVKKGAAIFTRGEGIWTGKGEIYFACTDGGTIHKGQIWRYVPSPEEGRPGEKRKPGRVELFVEPNDASVLENADNLTVAPWGDLVICEDTKRKPDVVGVTPEGRLYKIAANRLNNSEFAGACVSPDGKTLFVNVQNPGITFAITGPFERRDG